MDKSTTTPAANQPDSDLRTGSYLSRFLRVADWLQVRKRTQAKLLRAAAEQVERAANDFQVEAIRLTIADEKAMRQSRYAICSVARNLRRRAAKLEGSPE